MDLTNNDYLQILKYYKINHNKMNEKKIKETAENILASKLCRCIKKVDRKNEQRSIAICNKSVLRQKHLKNHGFTCKRKAKFVPKNKDSKNLVKTRSSIKLKRNIKK